MNSFTSIDGQAPGHCSCKLFEASLISLSLYFILKFSDGVVIQVSTSLKNVPLSLGEHVISSYSDFRVAEKHHTYEDKEQVGGKYAVDKQNLIYLTNFWVDAGFHGSFVGNLLGVRSWIAEVVGFKL